MALFKLDSNIFYYTWLKLHFQADEVSDKLWNLLILFRQASFANIYIYTNIDYWNKQVAWHRHSFFRLSALGRQVDDRIGLFHTRQRPIGNTKRMEQLGVLAVHKHGHIARNQRGCGSRSRILPESKQTEHHMGWTIYLNF